MYLLTLSMCDMWEISYTYIIIVLLVDVFTYEVIIMANETEYTIWENSSVDLSST